MSHRFTVQMHLSPEGDTSGACSPANLTFVSPSGLWFKDVMDRWLTPPAVPVSPSGLVTQHRGDFVGRVFALRFNRKSRFQPDKLDGDLGELRICSDEAVSKCSEQIATQNVSNGGELWAMRAMNSFSSDRIRDAGFGGTARLAEWREFDTQPDAYSHTQTRTESGEMR